MDYSLQAARASMSFVANMGHKGQLDGLGISTPNYLKFTGAQCWNVSDRGAMTQVLQSLIFACIDLQGLPRFTVPAEYVAAVIAVFVHGCNAMAACCYAPAAGEAESLARNIGGATQTNPSQLFALVTMLCSGDEHSAARSLYEKSVGLAVKNVVDPQKERIK